MYTHNLDPILFDFGFIAVRWYSLAYIFGILIGWWYGKQIILNRFKFIGEKFDLKEFDDLITYIVISIIIGGRIGYVLFYNLNFYWQNPLEILKIWQGGMSFHGALVGVIIGTYIFSLNRSLETFFFLDVIACVAPIGLFFGRLANFINAELVGKISSVKWGVVFPNIDLNQRHPSQIYEALLEGLILFCILNFFINKKNYKTGTCSCFFLIFYGIFRIFSEVFREPDVQIGYLFNIITMGSFLSIGMILVGLVIFNKLKKNEKQL